MIIKKGSFKVMNNFLPLQIFQNKPEKLYAFVKYQLLNKNLQNYTLPGYPIHMMKFK